ncbi:MAG TPA: bifunctional UDP-N-acetylglucosamine diphosphorylase/glucosamine-1-phosphate N-acetyltransferase GlmU [Elusimicrobiota bacterium]|nr:bifunctional UDP-N-acetylglucosamine diphosphorylase/glucosamine-1-phosphate N-acetyltransferase GlmU [Elusimicrobiota bacterium]
MKTAGKSSGQLGVLILAAGQGTRMVSTLPKVLHRLGGRPMIYYLVRLANAMKPSGIGIVVGHQDDVVRKEVQDLLKDAGVTRPVTFIHQKDVSGSGAAVIESLPFLKKFQTAMVLCGDTPLLTFDTVYAMLHSHRESKGQVTMLTARVRNPKGYGRILRSTSGEVIRVVEETEANPKEAAISEINSGTYTFEVPLLVQALKDLKPQGPKHERYLTQALEIMRQKGGRVSAYQASSPDEALGVNTRVQLALAERVLNRRMLERLMLSGVTVLDAETTYADADVEVGQDTVLLPGTILRGKTKVGRQCRIGPYTSIEDSSIGNETSVAYSVVSGARILEKSAVGPFAHLRPDTVAGPRARIGNFTEVKASRIGFGSKVPHLSYIGDSEIAEDVNVGAGTITCNYDGEHKHKTIIQAKAFIGSNVNLIAPIKVGRGARVGAGSTITQDVPDGNLAIARSQQVNKAGK